MSLDLVVPFPLDEPDDAAVRRSPDRRPIPALPTVAFVDNTKAKAAILLDAIGTALVAREAISDYFVYRKHLDMVPLDDAERDDLAARAHVVVTGVGDCGGCTACSVTDALRCIEAGVPAFVVVTKRFAGVAEATDAEYGVAGLEHLTVDHPIWTRDPDWFRATGAALATSVASALALEYPK